MVASRSGYNTVHLHVACHLPPLPPGPYCSEYNEDHADSRPNGRDAIPALYDQP
jgi:hypothetical protein